MGWKGWLVEGAVFAVSTLSEKSIRTGNGWPAEILVIRPNDFGDLLTTTPIFEALRRRFPCSKLIAGIGTWGHPILENNPFIDEIVFLDAPWNNKFVRDKSWKAVLRYLVCSEQIEALRRRKGPDVCIDIMGSHFGAVLMLRMRARHRVGVRGYRGGWSACHQHIRFSEGIHVARAALSQAELLGAIELPEARPQIYLVDKERAEAAQLWGGSRSGCRVLVGCGAGLEAKCLPATALGQALLEFSTAMMSAELRPNILLVGGPADFERSEKLSKMAIPGVRSMCDGIHLRTTFALAEKADLVVTHSSMLLHVAAAFRRPTLAILGGMHSDRGRHDRLWGYPPPYSSIGSTGSNQWPSPADVAEAAFKMLGVGVTAV